MFRDKATGSARIDWRAERNGIDLAAVATGLLGPAPGRRGERGRRLWWPCPFHEDRNPSFMVDPGKPWWKCWGCGERGNAANLVMRIKGTTFPEALADLTGRPAPSGTARPRHRPEAARPDPKPSRTPAGPSGMPLAEALALVAEAEARLWTHEGAEALAYLTGPRRLALGTIRAARLGWTPGVQVPKQGGGTFRARGVVIPWFEGGRLALVKIRQPEGDRPKYAEVFRDRPSLFPGRRVVRPGRPLVIAEGEFDALLLGQELGDLAAVVTLGGTGSSKPEAGIRSIIRAAPRWFIATDADEAGDKAAALWEGPRAERVRPPEGKDWTDAARAGVNHRLWWSGRLGVPFPPFSWDDLAGMRWGPATGDPEPGIVIDRPDPIRRPGSEHHEDTLM